MGAHKKERKIMDQKIMSAHPPSALRSYIILYYFLDKDLRAVWDRKLHCIMGPVCLLFFYVVSRVPYINAISWNYFLL